MTLLERMQQAPTLGLALPVTQPATHGCGFIRYREAAAGQGAPRVLLHGIGAGSASWQLQLDAAGEHTLSWDAPGYADSAPLQDDAPTAEAYAEVLWAWLDALGFEQVHLVGHSLGCIMASSAARLQTGRVLSRSLIAPAQGYGTAPLEVRMRKTEERLQSVRTLGIAGMARARAPNLLPPDASDHLLDSTRYLLSQLNERGYAQATRMLAQADIRADLQAVRALKPALPIRVACGELDRVTPPSACRALAQALGLDYTNLGAIGHMAPMEDPAQVTSWLYGA
jgi:pimeloyl-ACP methyl ester carboxylesterase